MELLLRNVTQQILRADGSIIETSGVCATLFENLKLSIRSSYLVSIQKFLQDILGKFLTGLTSAASSC